MVAEEVEAIFDPPDERRLMARTYRSDHVAASSALPPGDIPVASAELPLSTNTAISTARILRVQAVAFEKGTSLIAPVADVRVNCRITFHHDETKALR